MATDRDVVERFKQHPLIIRRLIDQLLAEHHPVVRLWQCCTIVETTLKIAAAVYGPLNDAALARRLAGRPTFGQWWEAAQKAVSDNGSKLPPALVNWVRPRDVRDPLHGLEALRNHLAHSPVLTSRHARDYAEHHVALLFQVIAELPWFNVVSFDDRRDDEVVSHVRATVDGIERDLFPVVATDWRQFDNPPYPVPYVYVRVEGALRTVFAAPIGALEVRRAFPDALELLQKRLGADGVEDLPSDIVERAVSVRGRSREVRRLYRNLLQADALKRPLWVHGVLGVGKSALLARLALALHERSSARSRPVASVIWLGLSATDAASPLDRLKEKLGLRADWELSRWLRDRARAVGSALDVVFIDGLDEVQSQSQRGQLLEFVQSVCAGRGSIRWIISSRSEHERFKCNAELAFPGGVPLLDADAVHAILMALDKVREAVVRTEDPVPGAPRGLWIKQVVDASGGLPLYVHLLCTDLLDGRIAPSCAVPASLDRYFADVLGRFGLDDVTRSLPVVLTVCALAGAPLDRGLLSVIAGRRQEDAAFVREAIERLLRLTLLIQTPDGVRLFHDRLRDHVRSAKTLKETRAAARAALVETLVRSPIVRARHPAAEALDPALADRLASLAVSVLKQAFSSPNERKVDGTVRADDGVGEPTRADVGPSPTLLKALARLLRSNWLITRIRPDATGLDAALDDLAQMEAIGTESADKVRKFLRAVEPAIQYAGRERRAGQAVSVLAHALLDRATMRTVPRWHRHRSGWLEPVQPPLVGHAGAVIVCLHAGQAWSAGGDDRKVIVWDLGLGTPTRTLPLPGPLWGFDKQSRIVWIGELAEGVVARELPPDELMAALWATLRPWMVSDAVELEPITQDDAARFVPRNRREFRQWRAKLALDADRHRFATAGYIVKSDHDHAATGASRITRRGRSRARWFHPGRVTGIAVREDGLTLVGDNTGAVLVFRADRKES